MINKMNIQVCLLSLWVVAGCYGDDGGAYDVLVAVDVVPNPASIGEEAVFSCDHYLDANRTLELITWENGVGDRVFTYTSTQGGEPGDGFEDKITEWSIQSNVDYDTLLFTMLIEELDADDYLCTAFDDILDEDSDTVTLDVQDPPEFIITASVVPSSAQPGDVVTFTCDFEGVGLSDITTLYWDDAADGEFIITYRNLSSYFEIEYSVGSPNYYEHRIHNHYIESGSQSFQMRLASDASGDSTFRCFLPGYEGFGATTLSIGNGSIAALNISPDVAVIGDVVRFSCSNKLASSHDIYSVAIGHDGMELVYSEEAVTSIYDPVIVNFQKDRSGITYEKVVGLEDNGVYECITVTSLEGTYFVYDTLVVLNTTNVQ